MLIPLVILLASALTAFIIGVRHLWLRSQAPAPGWWLIAAGLVLSFGTGAAWEWGPTSRWELLADHAGAAIMTCAAVVGLARSGRLRNHRGLRKRTTAAFLWSLPVAATLLAGYAVRMIPRVVDDGWWAAVPTPALIELAPWLPAKAVIRGAPVPSGWTIEDRIARNELWDWERERLRSRLEKRFRADPSATALAEWNMTRHERETDDALAAILFESMVGQFLDGSPADRQEAGHVLWDYLPTNGKIYHPHIGAKEGPRVTKGRTKRLMELALSSDFMDSITAVGLLAVNGDEAVEAVPTLVRISRSRGPSDWFEATETLGYLAATSPAVRERLIGMTQGPDAYERIMAIESLRQWNWHDPRVEAHLAHLAIQGDPVVSAFARRNGPIDFGRSEQSGDGYEQERAVFRYLDSDGPGRGGYLASVHELGDPLVVYVPRVIRALADSDAQVRAAACDVLVQMSWRREYASRLGEVRARVVELTPDADSDVRDAAKHLLDELDRK